MIKLYFCTSLYVAILRLIAAIIQSHYAYKCETCFCGHKCANVSAFDTYIIVHNYHFTHFMYQYELINIFYNIEISLNSVHTGGLHIDLHNTINKLAMPMIVGTVCLIHFCNPNNYNAHHITIITYVAPPLLSSYRLLPVSCILLYGMTNWLGWYNILCVTSYVLNKRNSIVVCLHHERIAYPSSLEQTSSEFIFSNTSIKHRIRHIELSTWWWNACHNVCLSILFSKDESGSTCTCIVSHCQESRWINYKCC